MIEVQFLHVNHTNTCIMELLHIGNCCLNLVLLAFASVKLCMRKFTNALYVIGVNMKDFRERILPSFPDIRIAVQTHLDE